MLAVVAYLLRMTSRLPRFGGSLGWDDAVITIAVLEVIPLSVLSVICKGFAVSQKSRLIGVLTSIPSG